jgi:hypothetical protein
MSRESDRVRLVTERLAGCVATWPTLEMMLSDVELDIPRHVVRPGQTPRLPQHRQMADSKWFGQSHICIQTV